VQDKRTALGVLPDSCYSRLNHQQNETALDRFQLGRSVRLPAIEEPRDVGRGRV